MRGGLVGEHLRELGDVRAGRERWRLTADDDDTDGRIAGDRPQWPASVRHMARDMAFWRSGRASTSSASGAVAQKQQSRVAGHIRAAVSP